MIKAYKSPLFGGEASRSLTRLALLALLAPALAGCSFALPSLVKEAPEETTGSIAPAGAGSARLFSDLGPEDWRRAKAALAVALDPQGNGQPVKWDNPETGMRGEIVPGGKPFVESDEICRSFKATVARPAGAPGVAEGTACRLGADEWHLKRVRQVVKT
ncbi:MAG: hypothetical protein JWR08_441 [Enterovirga sp.]|jgi:surface antigen|nr:hypothetical protein [Enterovirga sp.]